MNCKTNPSETLNDPEVRKYFLEILESNLSSQDKYDKFIRFFKLETEINNGMLSYGSKLLTDDKNKIDKILFDVVQKIGIWKPYKIIEQTKDSIKGAIRRLKNSQHRDGGWGFDIESSNFWGTAYAVLCLDSAKNLREIKFDVDFNSMVERGINWIEDNSMYWSVEHISPQGEMPVYEISLAIKCFYQVEKKHLSKKTSDAISQCVERLIESQNSDGGWDAKIWGTEVRSHIKVWSEVGATSFVLQALAETRSEKVRRTIDKGINWLIKTQNLDGSWNDGSCAPGKNKLSGKPSINKTCDALQGILMGKNNINESIANIDQAVEWLQKMEKPIIDENRNIKGWGWDDYTVAHFENTCLTLETLVELPDASLPLLTANAQWLMENQYKKDGDMEDGDWKGGHTARIALSLIEYYRKIKESPLFGIQKDKK